MVQQWLKLLTHQEDQHLGVGAGNTPAIIDETAHIKMAVNSILLSKTFDNGVICASEQSIIVIRTSL